MTYKFSIVPLTVAPDTNVMERLSLSSNRAVFTKVGLLKMLFFFLEADCGVSTKYIGKSLLLLVCPPVPLAHDFTGVAISILKAFY